MKKKAALQANYTHTFRINFDNEAPDTLEWCCIDSAYKTLTNELLDTTTNRLSADIQNEWITQLKAITHLVTNYRRDKNNQSTEITQAILQKLGELIQDVLLTKKIHCITETLLENSLSLRLKMTNIVDPYWQYAEWNNITRQRNVIADALEAFNAITDPTEHKLKLGEIVLEEQEKLETYLSAEDLEMHRNLKTIQTQHQFSYDHMRHLSRELDTPRTDILMVDSSHVKRPALPPKQKKTLAQRLRSFFRSRNEPRTTFLHVPPTPRTYPTPPPSPPNVSPTPTTKAQPVQHKGAPPQQRATSIQGPPPSPPPTPPIDVVLPQASHTQEANLAKANLIPSDERIWV